MSNIRKNFFYQAVFQVLSMLLPLVTSPLLSRSLGAEGVGTFVFVSTVENYFVLAANLGIYKYGTREIARVQNNKKERNKVFWEIWYTHSFLICVIGCAYLLYSFFISNYKDHFLVYFFAFLGSTISLDWLFAGMEDFKKIAIRDCTIKFLSFILIILLIHNKGDLTKYFILSSACFFLSGIFYWCMYRKYIDKSTWKIRISKKHLVGMIVLFVPVLLDTLYHSMDKLMLGIMCNNAEVGFYGNAEKALIAKKLVYSISIVLLPKMSSYLAEGELKKFNEMMKKSIGLILVLSIAFGFGTAGISIEFAILFWGKDFYKSGPLIMIMAFAMPAILISSSIREQYLIASGKEKKYFLPAILGAIVNLIINWMLIPKYGSLGAAVATLICELVVLFSQLIVVQKDIPVWSYFRGNFVYFVFGILMFSCIRIIGNSMETTVVVLLIQTIAGGTLYFVICCIYWKITNNEFYLNILNNIYARLGIVIRRWRR